MELVRGELRGGSDGHFSLTEHLDMDGEDQTDQMDQQTGGAKKKTKPKTSKKKVAKKVKGRKHRGGAMTEDQQNALYQAYLDSQSPNKIVKMRTHMIHLLLVY